MFQTKLSTGLEIAHQELLFKKVAPSHVHFRSCMALWDVLF